MDNKFCVCHRYHFHYTFNLFRTCQDLISYSNSTWQLHCCVLCSCMLFKPQWHQGKVLFSITYIVNTCMLYLYRSYVLLGTFIPGFICITACLILYSLHLLRVILQSLYSSYVLCMIIFCVIFSSVTLMPVAVEHLCHWSSYPTTSSLTISSGLLSASGQWHGSCLQQWSIWSVIISCCGCCMYSIHCLCEITI